MNHGRAPLSAYLRQKKPRHRFNSSVLALLLCDTAALLALLRFGAAAAPIGPPTGSWRGENGETLTIGPDQTVNLQRSDSQVRAAYTLPDPTHLRIEFVTRAGTNSASYSFSSSGAELFLTNDATRHVSRFQRAEVTSQPAAPASPAKPKLYDESADGSQQVDHALAAARRDHKHVLLQFGANWCGWCRKLDKLFASDPAIASELGQHYLVVLIDVDRGHNQEVDARYGHPTRFGLPAIVVLNQDGKPLTTQDTGQLEQGDHHDPEKVLAFLKHWAPKPVKENQQKQATLKATKHTKA